MVRTSAVSIHTPLQCFANFHSYLRISIAALLALAVTTPARDSTLLVSAFVLTTACADDVDNVDISHFQHRLLPEAEGRSCCVDISFSPIRIMLGSAAAVLLFAAATLSTAHGWSEWIDAGTCEGQVRSLPSPSFLQPFFPFLLPRNIDAPRARHCEIARTHCVFGVQFSGCDGC